MPVPSVLLVVDTSQAMASGRRLERLQRGLEALAAELAFDESGMELALFSSSGGSVPLEAAATFVVPRLELGEPFELGPIGVGPCVDLYQLGDCSPSDAPAHRVQPAELPAFFEWLAARMQGEARSLPGSGSEGGGSPPAEVGVALRMVARARC